MTTQQNQNGNGNEERREYPAVLLGMSMVVHQPFALKNPSTGAVYGTALVPFHSKNGMAQILTVHPNNSRSVAKMAPIIFDGMETTITPNKKGNLVLSAKLDLPKGISNVIFMKPKEGPISVFERLPIAEMVKVDIPVDVDTVLNVDRMNILFSQLNEFDFVLSIQTKNWKKIIIPNLNGGINVDLHVANMKALKLIQVMWPELMLKTHGVTSENDNTTAQLSWSFEHDGLQDQEWFEFQRFNNTPGIISMVALTK